MLTYLKLLTPGFIATGNTLLQLGLLTLLLHVTSVVLISNFPTQNPVNSSSPKVKAGWV